LEFVCHATYLLASDSTQWIIKATPRPVDK